MRRVWAPFVAVACLIAVSGCHPPQITGVWEGVLVPAPELSHDSTSAMQVESIGTLTLDVKDDNSFKITGNLPMSGKWKETPKGWDFEVVNLAGKDVPKTLKVRGGSIFPVTYDAEHEKLILTPNNGETGTVEFRRKKG